jgi:hypothetical protein
MTAAIQQKEFELQSLSEGEGNSDTRNLLDAELNILKERAAIFLNSKFRLYTSSSLFKNI